MMHTRTSSPLSGSGTVVGLLLLMLQLALSPQPTSGFPTNGRELDSAVEGVQKYLESSGFPKMTRGEVLDFLNDFSRNARVSRSDGGGGGSSGKRDASSPQPQPQSEPRPQPQSKPQPQAESDDGPAIPAGESPLNYGYPMSVATNKRQGRQQAQATAGRGDGEDASTGAERNAEAVARAIGGRSGAKKTVGPTVDLNAYAKFKKIPEGKNLKLDDDMKAFLGGFGLLDGAAAKKDGAAAKTVGAAAVQKNNATTKTDGAAAAQKNNATAKTDGAAAVKTVGETAADDSNGSWRRADDDAAVTETVDEALLKSVLVETGGVNETDALSRAMLQESASNTRENVFNPSDADVRTVDVNRIAKIVENIRLLADDNATVSLSQEAIQKKLENITSAIADIDRQPAAGAAAGGPDRPFDGYEVFFDDDSKEVDSDLPESPAGGGAAGVDADALARLPLDQAPNPPDPLSTDELQHLLEKNKNDVKRQQPATDATTSTAATTPASTAASTDDSASIATTSASADDSASAASTSSSSSSSSEATSTEATSDATAARDSSTAAATDVSPSLSQLAESFGGGETASSPPQTAVVAPESPSRPRSGLYFYADWNTFLTVNEGEKNQVNLRFAPKAGNPAHFIRVTVP